MSEPTPKPARPQNPNEPVDPALAAMLHEEAGHGGAPAAPKKKKRWWLRIVGGIFLLIIVLVICAPYIASSAPVRSIVVSKVNENLNGSVAIADYSVGWTGGIKASGVQVLDANKKPIISVPQVSTKLSLLDAIRGNLDLGDTRIDVRLDNVTVDENGNSNLASIAKQSETTKSSAPHEPKEKSDVIELPNIKGKLTVNILGGSVTGAGVPAPITIEPSTVLLDIPDVNQPIQDNIKLAYRLGDAKPSTISVSGTVDAVEGGKVDLKTIDSKLKAQQKIALDNVDLGAATPILKKSLGEDAELGGIASGALDVNAQGLTGISANGELRVDDAKFAGAGLKDQLALKNISVPIQITRTVVDANNTQIKIEKLAVNTPLANVNVSGQVQQEALLNLADKKAPGSDGRIDISLLVSDIGAVTRALPNTFKLKEGVEVNSGSLASNQQIVFAKDRVTSSQKLDLTASGTREQDGQKKPIRLTPIHLETGVAALPNGKAVPAIRDLKLLMQSSFLTLNGGGQSLAAIDIKGNLKLSKLRDELAQFTDALDETQLSGDGDLAITTKGDPTNAAAPIETGLNLNLTNVRVSGATTQPINQPRIALAAGGKILRDNDGAPTMFDNGSLTFQAGDQTNPLIDVAASAKADLKNGTVPAFELSKLAINRLDEAQRQFGGLVSGLQEQQIRINSGALYAQVAGKFENDTVTLTKPLGVSLPNLQVAKAGRTVITREDITATINGAFGVGKTTRANLSTLDFRAKSNLFSISKSGEAPIDVTLANGGVSGNGAIAINADLKRLNDIAQAFSAEVSAKPASNEAGELKSGKFDGVLKLAHAQGKGTDINFDGSVSDVTITTSGKPLQNEQIKLAAAANSPDDLSGVSVSNASLESRFATAKVSNAKLKLDGGTWELVQSANVDAQVPDVAALWTIMQAFSPPAAQAAASTSHEPLMMSMQVRGDEPISAPKPKKRERQAPKPQPEATETADQPLPPLQVKSGSASLKVNVARDAATKTTTATLSEMKLSNLALARGDKSYAFDKDITFFLKAAIAAADVPNRTLVQQIRKISIDPLSGDLGGIAKLSMPKPIEASGIDDIEKLTANGSIKLEGTLEALSPLLNVLSGSPLPYTGSYVTTQTIGTRNTEGTRGTLIALNGDLTANDFTVYDAGGKPSFTEKRVNLRNDIDVFPQAKELIVRQVTLDMPESQAVAMKFVGRVKDWEQNRNITGDKGNDPARLDLGYDLAKLWPIIKPSLSPETQESLKDLKIEGRYQKTFNVYGKYPARSTWQESVRYLGADGSFAVQLLDTSGLNVQNLDVPVTLDKGVLTTVYGGKSGQTGAAKPASCNGGTFDLSNISVVLTTPEPRVSISKNHKLLDKVTINPLLGDSVGKYINPVFTNTQRAKGLLAVTIDSCDSVALGEALKTAESGSATTHFSITDMDIANPVGSLMFGKVLGALKMGGSSNQADVFEGQIKDALITLDRGRTTQKLTMELLDPGKPSDAVGSARKPRTTTMKLTFDGDVRLSDLKQQINVTLPPELVAKFVPTDQSLGRNLAKYFPEGIPIALRGTTTKPEVDVGNIFQKFLEGQLKSGLTGDGDGKDSGLGGILDKLGGGKKKDDKKKNR